MTSTTARTFPARTFPARSAPGAAPAPLLRALPLAAGLMVCLGSAWGVFCCAATAAPSEPIATATSAAVAAAAEVPVTPARLLEPGVPEAIPIGAIAIGTGAIAADPAGSARGAPAFDLRITAFLATLLAAVLCLKWSGRRPVPRPPAEVFAVLGEASLGGQHVARIVRFGPKTILVGVSGTTCTALAEIDDPDITDSITAACHPRAVSGAERVPLRLGLPLRIRTAARAFVGIAIFLVAALPAAPTRGDDAPATPFPVAPSFAPEGPSPPAIVAMADVRPATEIAALPAWSDVTTRALGPRSVDGILSAVILFGVASIAPAILLMTTSFVRMSVVLSLVRQGLGTQGLPSNQIVTSLALFLSLLVMWPVWTSAYREGVQPLQDGQIDLNTAFERGSMPVRRWMAGQIEHAGNRQTMLLFLSRHPSAPREVRSYDDVPLETLLPAFLVSELKTAFSIGVRLLLPFLVLDLLVATLLASTGLGMVSPATVSLPLKLIVFVMADGWTLVVRSLLDGVRTAA